MIYREIKKKIILLVLIILFTFLCITLTGCTYEDVVGIIVDKYEHKWVQMMPVGKSFTPVYHTSYRLVVEHEYKGDSFKQTTEVSESDYGMYQIGDFIKIKVRVD